MHHLTTEMLPAIQAELKAVLCAEIHPPVDHLHGMMQYHMGWLDEQFEPLESNAGKQIRPLLCLLACHAAGGDWRQALPAAAAVELLHNFSLIHDDIEDNSPTRRGRATSWRIWGVPLATNAGDAMFSVAHLALNRLVERGVSADITVRALRRFDETCLALTQGQQADMLFESRTEVSVEEYVAMITGKTSVLLALCAELGALIAGVGEETAADYSAFGLNLGLAFQVQDDILGIWGDEAVIGKSATSDIETRKKTLPVLYGLAHNPALRELYAQVEHGSDFVPRVVALLDESGARPYAENRARQYSQAALDHLHTAAPRHPTPLEALTEMLLARKA
ncbi:MAG: polyprenyl synthetase family protein [Chloroflexi bacterium]|nr:polyprenyl synthetase family protein [Chloroflexota bacterium]